MATRNTSGTPNLTKMADAPAKARVSASENAPQESAPYQAHQALHAQQKQTASDLVDVHVPRGFMLTADDHTTHKFDAGDQQMKRAFAEHFYSKAHGVTIKADTHKEHEDEKDEDNEDEQK